MTMQVEDNGVTLNLLLRGPLRRDVIFNDIYDYFTDDSNLLEANSFGMMIFENSSDIRDKIVAKVGQIKNFLLYGVGWEHDQVINRLWQSTGNPNLSYSINSDIDFSLLESRKEVTATITGTIDDPSVAIPQYVDQLVLGEQYTVLRIGQTLTLDEFQKLGKYYIETKLIYDNYLVDADDVGCMGLGIGSENIEYPVRTNGGGIFCIMFLEGWINQGHTDDPNRAEITTIHVMTQEEIMQQEWADIQDQRNHLTTEINILKRKRQQTKSNEEAIKLMRKQREYERQLANLPTTPQDHRAKKIKRIGMNRLRLKF